MNTRLIVTILSIIGTSAFAVVALFLIPGSRNKITAYSFNRKFLSKRIYPIEKIQDIGLNSFYIAGNTTETVFLANPTSLRTILTVSVSSLDTQYFRIEVQNFHKYIAGSYKTAIDSPHFFLMDGTQPVILKGKIRRWSTEIVNTPKEFFTLALPIAPNSLVMRSVSNKTGTNVVYLEKANPYELISNDDLLQPQVDGLFCTDGMLLQNRHLNKIIYLYYYRNEIVLADTNLNLSGRLKTIDPIDSANLQVATIQSEKTSVLAKPPLLVNKLSCTFKDWLFINSVLLSSNDDHVLFKEGSVIDVYNLKRQAYQFSFYLPSYKGNKLKDFRVLDGCIFSLYDQYIIKFALNPDHLK